MKKFAYPVVFLGWLLIASLVSGLAQAGDEIGIDRSNLTRESEAVQEKTLQDIHALGMPHGSGMCFQERHRKLWPSSSLK